MRPRYIDLFKAMCESDRERADAAFDSVLRERGSALEDIWECYQLSQEPGSLEKLLGVAEYPVVALRFDLVQLMGFSESPSALPMAIEALRDPHPATREEACWALVDLGGLDALGALEERLEDLEPRVRQAASQALDELRS
ncbi:MAG: HEAT repeat domain-containing protein [Myxococcota bacterium]|nr:HEAT repeat domain-containing protein [Myxococcota bacterium]